jgi:ABC-2 type transport system permease protein
MFTLWKLTIASIKMYVRNKQAIFFTFFTPLLIMVIFGAIGFDNTKINVGVVVQGSLNAPTQQFMTQLQAIPAFKLSYGSRDVEQKALEAGSRSVVIVLANNPFQAAPSQNPGTLTVLSNAGDTMAPIAVSIIEQMLDKAALQISHAPQLVKVVIEPINAHNLKYIDFLLPGLVALSIMQLSVFSVAFVFVDYKEKGILKRVLATPVKPYQFVLANVITRLLVSVFQAAFFIAIGVIFFKVQIVGSYWLILLVVILEAITFLGLGFVISGLSKTTEAVPAFANLIVFPMIFLGGTFFSVDAMPTWLQYISKVLPLTYFSGALRDIMTRGIGFSGILYDLWWMIGWAVVLLLLSILTFRFDEKRVG